MLDVLLKGAWFCIQHDLPDMPVQREGTIANDSSKVVLEKTWMIAAIQMDSIARASEVNDAVLRPCSSPSSITTG